MSLLNIGISTPVTSIAGTAGAIYVNGVVGPVNGAVTLTLDPSISGGSSNNGALVASGALLYGYIVGGDTNLSGNLTSTGATLVALNANTSGVLAAQIAANSAGVSTLNGRSGALTIATAGSDLLFTSISGQTIFLSGQLIASTTGLAATGQQAWTVANNNGINLSGRLAQTGQALVGLVYGGDANLSGALVSMSGQLVTQIQSAAGVLSLNGVTGLVSLGGINGESISVSGTTIWISGTSGYNAAVYATIANLASTGQQAWTAAQNNGTNLSGNLFTTGANLGATITNVSGGLQAQVFATGAAGVTYGNNTFATLTNLTLTGQTSQNNALNLSGNLNTLSGWLTNSATSNIVYTTGNQSIISGVKTFQQLAIDSSFPTSLGHDNSTVGTASPRFVLLGSVNSGGFSGSHVIAGIANTLNSPSYISGFEIFGLSNNVFVSGFIASGGTKSLVVAGGQNSITLLSGDGRAFTNTVYGHFNNLFSVGRMRVTNVLGSNNEVSQYNKTVNVSNTINTVGDSNRVISAGTGIDNWNANVFGTSNYLLNSGTNLSILTNTVVGDANNITMTGRSIPDDENGVGYFQVLGNFNYLNIATPVRHGHWNVVGQYNNIWLTGATQSYFTLLGHENIISSSVPSGAPPWSTWVGGNLNAIRGNYWTGIEGAVVLGHWMDVTPQGGMMIFGIGNSQFQFSSGIGLMVSDTGNYVSSGLASIAQLRGLSGSLVSQIAANAVGVSTLNGRSGALTLATAGSDLLFTSVSGQTIFISGQLIASTTGLAATGQQAWTAANNNATNLSGNLFTTGATLVALNAATSGAIVSQITSSSAGVSSLNGSTGVLTLTPAPANANYIKVTTSGTTIMVSGDTTPLLSGISLPGGALLSGNGGGLFLRSSTGSSVLLGNSGTAPAVIYAALNNLQNDPAIVFHLPSLNRSGYFDYAGNLNLSQSVVAAGGFNINSSLGIGYAPSRIWFASSSVGTSDAGFDRLNAGVTKVSSGNLGGFGFLLARNVFLTVTGDYTASGVTSIAQMSALSGDLANGNTSRTFAAKTYQAATSGIAVPLIGASLTGTYNVDFTNSPGLQTLTITGSTLISGINYANGGAVTMRINVSGANAAALRFPATWNNGWVTTVPTGIATGRFGLLTMNTFTAAESGLMIAFAVAP